MRFIRLSLWMLPAILLSIPTAASGQVAIFVDGFESGDTAAWSHSAGVVCEVVADCSVGDVCAAGFCVAEGSVGVGGQCSANRDCSTSLYCSLAGICLPAGSGLENDYCSSGDQCAEDLACDLYGLGGTCEAAGAGDLGDGCTASADCIAGLVCGPLGFCDRGIDAFPPFPGVACAADAAPFKVFFQVPRPGQPIPDFFRLPFPNDARVNVDGTLDLSDFPRPGPTLLGIDLVDLYADALTADFDGFSSVADVTFRFSKELDFDTVVANGGQVHFIDITNPADPDFGSDRARTFSYSANRNKYACQHTFQVAPQRHDVLLPGRVYAAYLSSAIRSAAAEPPVLDADLAAVLAPSQPADPTLARVWTQYTNFRIFLTQQTMTPADIAGVTVFTVQDTTGKMVRIDAAVEALPLPALSSLTLCDGATASPCDGTLCTSPVSFWQIHGRVSIPNYQQGTLPYEYPADGGAIAYGGSGAPLQQGVLEVCLALTVPKSAMPGAGWPLVVHAHGTGGNFRAAIDDGIAEELATASVPMATLTVDGVASGERRGASTRDADGLVFNVVNPRAARDNHLQGAVDVIQALRVAQALSGAVGGVNIELDASRTYFFGHSQGSNVGVPALATTGLAKAAILSGAGSYLTEGLLTKTSPVNAGHVLSLLVGEPISNGHPIMTLWQTFFDRMDPVNFDPLMIVRPPTGVVAKHVHMTWGLGDTFSREPTLNITARGIGLANAEPIVTPINGVPSVVRPVSGNVIDDQGLARTAACYQYQSDGTYDGHFVAQRNPAAIIDWLSFLTSAATAGTPTVP